MLYQFVDFLVYQKNVNAAIFLSLILCIPVIKDDLKQYLNLFMCMLKFPTHTHQFMIYFPTRPF